MAEGSTGNALRESPMHLLDVRTIYHEPDIERYPTAVEILQRWPNAERIEVASHWRIEGLHGNEGLVERWNAVKRETIVLGVKKGLACRPNERSSDFVAPSHSNGCAMACAYCYVPRRKGFANPITTFVNIEQICGYIEKHAERQGFKMTQNQCDPTYWVYDIGENGDCSVDALISGNVRKLVDLFRSLPNAKATFATKFVNRELLEYHPGGKTRVRFSLMPEEIARIVDVRTTPVAQRIDAINDFVEAGYEVHINFSPVIYTETWEEDYVQLFRRLDDTLSPAAKKQLQAEVIFLTHNDRLHQVNLGWHPKAEELLWRPEIQQPKFSQTGGLNVRYKNHFKGKLVERFQYLLKQELSYCNIRYAF